MFIAGEDCLINMEDVSTIYIDRKNKMKVRMKDGSEYALGWHPDEKAMKEALSSIADSISMGYEVFVLRYSGKEEERT